MHIGGTAFFLSHPIEGDGIALEAQYLVTARHNVDTAKENSRETA